MVGASEVTFTCREREGPGVTNGKSTKEMRRVFRAQRRRGKGEAEGCWTEEEQRLSSVATGRAANRTFPSSALPICSGSRTWRERQGREHRIRAAAAPRDSGVLFDHFLDVTFVAVTGHTAVTLVVPPHFLVAYLTSNALRKVRIASNHDMNIFLKGLCESILEIDKTADNKYDLG